MDNKKTIKYYLEKIVEDLPKLLEELKNILD